MSLDPEDRPVPDCDGGGVLVEYLGQDSFGNWDTREYECDGCAKCKPECDGLGTLITVAGYEQCVGCKACEEDHDGETG